jgi:S1-C subfamily serine protease
MPRQRVLFTLLLSLVTVSAWGFPPPPPPTAPGPVIGMRVAKVPYPQLERLGLEFGVRVVDLVPGSPAARAGLAPGDLLVSLNGRPIYSPRRLLWLMAQADPTGALALEIQRGGERRTLSVEPSSPPLPSPQSSYLGLYLQDMGPQLRQVFGVAPGTGVLVSEVISDSPAEAAGVRTGDVLVRLAGTTLVSAAQVRRVVGQLKPGNRVAMEIVRGSETQTLGIVPAPRPEDQDPEAWMRHWSDPETLRGMLPPPEYWRQLMDRTMESLQESWSQLRRRWPEEQREYY